MLERAVRTGRAPVLPGDHGARHLRRLVLRGVPVGDAGVRGDDRHRRAPGPPPHPVHELVQPRGAPLRRVRVELQRVASLRDHPPAHRHHLQHERRAPAEPTSRRCSRRSTTSAPRTACTTYLIYRGRHEHEISRETALTRLASAVMRRTVRGPARALLRRHLRHARDRVPLAARAAGHPRPARRLRRRPPRRARPLRLPAAVAARQRQQLPPQRPARAGRRRSPRPTASSSACSTPAGGRTRSSTSTRSSSSPTTRTRPSSGASSSTTRSTASTSLPPSGAGHDEAEIALCPAQRSAMVYALLREGRDALVPADRRRGARARGRRPRHVATGPAGGGDPRRGAASCASRRAATSATSAARAGRSTASLEDDRRAGSATACCARRPTPTRSRACGRR